MNVNLRLIFPTSSVHIFGPFIRQEAERTTISKPDTPYKPFGSSRFDSRGIHRKAYTAKYALLEKVISPAK
jgi:hypothetical protein